MPRYYPRSYDASNGLGYFDFLYLWTLSKIRGYISRCSLQQRSEAYYLLSIWSKPKNPLHALTLLDVYYADSYVRKYAVDILEELSDSDLQQV